MGEIETSVGVSARDLPHAAEAAARLASDRCGWSAEIRGDVVELRGSGDVQGALRAWRTRLLNERLVAEAEARRKELLGSLLA